MPSPPCAATNARAEGRVDSGTIAEVWGARVRGMLVLRRQLAATTARRSFMVILGIVLIVVGLLVASLNFLLIIGVILLVVGLILNVVPMGGSRRRVY
jgi:membrane-bound ClpP family serine protease